MAEEIDRKLVDKRTVSRYLRKGIVDEKDYERHLKSLPDLAEQAITVESEYDDELDDEDDVVESDEGSSTPGA